MASLRTDFWRRNGLDDVDRTNCLEAVGGCYDGYRTEEFKYQGYCSFTLLLTPETKGGNNKDGIKSSTDVAGFTIEKQLIIQLRPAQHALDLNTAFAARNAYPRLTPSTQAVDLRLPRSLQAYEMDKMDGVPFSCLQSHASLTGLRQKQMTLITSFAKIIAQSWPTSESRKRRDSVITPESPENNETAFLSLCTGKVGSRIVQKLEELCEGLPNEWLRARASIVLEKVRDIHDYPVVLNHGDLIPSNILVNEETWHITGLVDWAEAEWLPFGTCFYGLEYLLGFLRQPLYGSGGPAFGYYDNAACLRDCFWSTLINVVPELGGRTEEVKLMRDVGVLLWHGYAWDEGAIDRVVDEANDGEELAKLRAFLSI
ncbi:hypothetical protein SVAN01_08729 [Stagonosporopsis vannaccii]|nr:hypothetical protein SVAN01_08729 [Stagonosporopsis vannaccii]